MVDRSRIQQVSNDTMQELKRKSSWNHLKESRLTDRAKLAKNDKTAADINAVLGSYYNSTNFRVDVMQVMKYKQIQDISVLTSPYNFASTPDLQEQLQESMGQYSRAITWMESFHNATRTDTQRDAEFGKLVANYNRNQMDSSLMRVVNAMEDVKNAYENNLSAATAGLTNPVAMHATRIDVSLHGTDLFQSVVPSNTGFEMGGVLSTINDAKVDGTGTGITSSDGFDFSLEYLAKHPGDFIHKLEVLAVTKLQQDIMDRVGVPFKDRIAKTRSETLREITNMIYKVADEADDPALVLAATGAIHTYLEDSANQAQSKYAQEMVLSRGQRVAKFINQEVRPWITIGCTVGTFMSNVHGWVALDKLVGANNAAALATTAITGLYNVTTGAIDLSSYRKGEQRQSLSS